MLAVQRPPLGLFYLGVCGADFEVHHDTPRGSHYRLKVFWRFEA